MMAGHRLGSLNFRLFCTGCRLSISRRSSFSSFAPHLNTLSSVMLNMIAGAEQRANANGFDWMTIFGISGFYKGCFWI